jgi:formylmethanofuran dehydrogenase subunit B
MTTVKLKSDLFRFIEEINDKNVLSALRKFLSSKRKRKKDFWDDLSEEECNEILKAMRDLDKGYAHSFEGVISRHKKK